VAGSKLLIITIVVGISASGSMWCDCGSGMRSIMAAQRR
jgi:hypothetical protein